MKYSFIALILILTQLSAHAFRLNTNVGAAFDSDEVEIFVTSNSTCTSAGISQDDLLDYAVEAADKFWNKVPGANIKVVKGKIKQTSDSLYLTGILCASDSDSSCDSSTTVPRSSEIIIACNSNTSDNFPSSAYLAISAPTKISGSTIKGSVILINDSASSTFSNLSRDEVINVLAHEIGHALGIGHSEKDEALMYYSNSDKISKLSQDDIDALVYLYGNDITEGCFGPFGATVSFEDNDTPPPSNFLKSFVSAAALAFAFLFIPKIITLLGYRRRQSIP